MKKNILFGALVFILGMSMVACGQQRAATGNVDGSEISIPTTPGIALDSNGQASTICSSSSCQFVGFTDVGDPTRFAQLGGGEYFAPPGSNAGTFSGSVNNSIQDQWDAFRDNCDAGFTIGFGGGKLQTDLGFQCDFVQGSALPVLQGYATTIAYNVNTVQLTLQIPAQGGYNYLTINAVNDGRGRYLSPENAAQLTQVTSNGVITGFYIQLIQNGSPIQIGKVSIGSNY